MSQAAITSTTQDFLDIFDITNDMVFMKDGSAAAILLVSAMNFSLLAEEEQDAVIYAYAALLNSLNFQIQINLQSKTKDATAYLELLKTQEDEAVSLDKKRRIGKYREFVTQLIQERNVLDKKFYVVIPATPSEVGLVSPQSMFSGKAQVDVSTIEKNTLLEKSASILQPRVDHLIGQFNRIGLYARRFTTQEIIQNYYSNYNPEAVEGQQITDTSDYATPLVEAHVFGASVKNRQQVIQQFTHSLAEAEKGIAQPLSSPGALRIEPEAQLPIENLSQTPQQPVELAVMNETPQVAQQPEIEQIVDNVVPVQEMITPEANILQPAQSAEPNIEIGDQPALQPSGQLAPQQIAQPNDQLIAQQTDQLPPQSYSLPPVAEIK